MTWWAWTLLWLVLVAAAGLVVYGLVRRLIRQGVALARELGEAADRLAEVSRALEAVSGDPAAAEPAPDAGAPSPCPQPGGVPRPPEVPASQDVR